MNTTSHLKEGVIGWFARNNVASNLLLISVIILGLFSLKQLRQEVFPLLEPHKISISVMYNSGDPLQAEQGIAIKIEEALESVAGIDQITSTSYASGATVVVEKQSEYDLDVLYDDIRAKVNTINNLPAEAKKPLIEKAQREQHAIWVQLYGDADRATFQYLAQQLKADLLQKPAIHKLAIKTQADPIIAIDIDELKLQTYGLTLSDISQAINAESIQSINANLRNKERTVRLKLSDQKYQAEQFATIPIRNRTDGRQLILADVAQVHETFDEDIFKLSRYNQQPAMAIEIVMDDFGDVSAIAEQANKVVADWQTQQRLPASVQIKTWQNASHAIQNRLSLLFKNAITGIILVFVVLAVFLNIRVAFWVAAGLPFVLFGTLYFMTDNFVGLTINQMTTFGFIMALGIVVDDAVVVGESIYATRRADGDTIENTIRGTLKVAIPTIFGVLTTVATFLALANVHGRLGKIYAQFATVVTICLLLSIVESKLILPSHLAHLNTRRKQKSNPWDYIQQGADQSLQWINDKVYKKFIRIALQYRYAVIIGFMTLFVLVAGMPITGKIRVAFFPDIAGDNVRAEIAMYNDSSFGQLESALLFMEKTALQADQTLAKQYGLTHAQITDLKVSAENDLNGQLVLTLDHNDSYNAREFIQEWQKQVGHLEGVKKLKIRSKRDMGDNFKAVLRASDFKTANAAAIALKQALNEIDGVSGVEDNISQGEPIYKFTLSEQGRALGFRTDTLAHQVLNAFGANTVQTFQRDSDELQVKVRYPSQQRQTLADILSAKVRTPQGQVVALTTVADVLPTQQSSVVTRIDQMRAIFITAVVDKKIIASNELVDELKETTLPSIKQQFAGVSISFKGEAKRQQEATSSMQDMFILAIIVIYALLAIPLRSYVQPLLIMMAIPFGIVGAILGHYINDLTISILSLNGIIALSGVVVNDSLLLVTRFNELIAEDDSSIEDAIVEACTGRLRAVLLTSFTTFAGLAPLLGETSVQAQFLIPAAASLGYGILFATLITLLLIPALICIQYDWKKNSVSHRQQQH